MKEKRWFQNIGISLFIVVLGFSIYSGTRGGKFLWDDHLLVKDNVYVTSFKHTDKIFSEDFGGGAGVRYNFYRPLQIFSYCIEHALWGFNPAGYHLTNVILHILVVLVLFSLILLIFKRRILALAASLLFLVHPVHTETVSYISDRGDLLSAFFMLSSLAFYILCADKGRKRFYPLALLFFLCALLSKENALILPLLILVYHYSFRKKCSALLILPFVGVTIGYILLRLMLTSSFLAHVSGSSGIMERLPGFFAAFGTYLRLLLAPYGLHAEYGSLLFSWHDGRVIAGILGVLAMLSFAAAQRRKRPLLTFSFLWFCAGLLPFTNIYPLPFYMAEHYVYISSIGYFLLPARAFELLLTRKKWRFAAAGMSITSIVILSFLTVRQNRYWQEPLAFYKNALAYSPHNSRIWHNMADAYNARGEYPKAIEAYKKSLDLDPSHADTYTNLGTVYYATAQYEKAVAMYHKALALDGGYAPAHNNLGVVYEALGRNAEALVAYQKALNVNPYYVKAYFNRGHLYQQTNNMGSAVAEYKKAVAINPAYPEAYNNLGVVYFNAGRIDEALAVYKTALRINPGFAEAYYNLGLLYARQGDKEKAIQAFRETIQFNYQHVDALYNLGLLYRSTGNIADAIDVLKKAHALAPQDTEITAFLRALESRR